MIEVSVCHFRDSTYYNYSDRLIREGYNWRVIATNSIDSQSCYESSWGRALQINSIIFYFKPSLHRKCYYLFLQQMWERERADCRAARSGWSRSLCRNGGGHDCSWRTRQSAASPGRGACWGWAERMSIILTLL